MQLLLQLRKAEATNVNPLDQETASSPHQVPASEGQPHADGHAAGIAATRGIESNVLEGQLAPPIIHQIVASSGQGLDVSVRKSMEAGFGHDFSRVRIHTGREADDSTRAVAAAAYTVGNHIVFGAGRYEPASAEGRHLLAHEITHVVQQQGSTRVPALLRIGSPADSLEREADHVADDFREPSTGSPLMALHPLAGNYSAGSMSHGPARLQAPKVQRAGTGGAAAAKAANAARRAKQLAQERDRKRTELAASILREWQVKGGLTVAFYGGHVHGPGAAGEFKRQAEQFADDHGAIGLKGGGVKFGAAMDITKEIPALLADLETELDKVLLESRRIPVQTLAIFTHGIEKKLEAGPPQAGQTEQVQWIQDVKGWVGRIAPYMSPSPTVLLFACRAGGKPATGVPFAEAVEEYLQDDLAMSYPGPGMQVDPKVWGHKTAAHTVANPNLVEFSGGIPAVQDDFPTRLGAAMTDRAVKLAGRSYVARAGSSGLPPITAGQRSALVSDAARRVLKIFQISPAEQTSTNPKVVYFREIPMMGMDRMIADLLTDATPDFSYLRLSAKATARVASGFQAFKGMVDKELPWLMGLAQAAGMGDFPKARRGSATA
jgi:hypothetical protein